MMKKAELLTLYEKFQSLIGRLKIGGGEYGNTQ